MNFLYAKTHEWVSFKDETTATVGISDFAQHELGDVVYIGLPAVGDSVMAGVAFGEVESVKAVSDIISPVTGTVSAINAALEENPARLNEAPCESWLIEVENISMKSELMTEAEYKMFCSEEAKD